VLYLGRPEVETVDSFPLPPVEFLSRDNDPPVAVTFNTDMVRRPPENVGEPGAD
jgi:hypothetical protein